MPPFAKFRGWTLGVVAVGLGATVSVLSSVPAAHTASPWDGHPAHRAVWMVLDAKRAYQASAFAIEPRLAITVAHNLFDVLKAGTDRVMLVQSDPEGQIEVARVRAISTTHDLALLETAAPMEHFLSIAGALPHGLADQFHAAGYAKGKFATLSVITQTFHGDVDYYDLPMDRVIRGGVSGGPVLAPNGEAIAMLRTSNGNLAGAVRYEVLSDFLQSKRGVSCGSRNLKGCLEAAVRRTGELAEDGDLAAQFQLGRGDSYIKGEPGMRWLERAAEGGHARASRDLGNALFDGERGLVKDWERSNYWLRLAAEEQDAVAQNNLSLAYLFGEGVTKDAITAMDWLDRALGNGYVGAETNLGINYYEGVGVVMDKELGNYWLRRAAERGDEYAQDYLEANAD